jgi:AdoMet-dependent rRNA methyltransferase SPB1
MFIGIDLAPMKLVPRATVLQQDITTPQCRAEIKKILKGQKIDTLVLLLLFFLLIFYCRVLHDGSPNVGTAWTQDAYSQSELVLASLKLATEFIKPGGNIRFEFFSNAVHFAKNKL